MKKKAEYEGLRFDSEEEYVKWLELRARYIVKFENGGQDFSTWWIDEGGEILNSDLQGSVWNSKIVDPASIKEGSFIRFSTGEELLYKCKTVEVRP